MDARKIFLGAVSIIFGVMSYMGYAYLLKYLEADFLISQSVWEFVVIWAVYLAFYFTTAISLIASIKIFWKIKPMSSTTRNGLIDGLKQGFWFCVYISTFWLILGIVLGKLLSLLSWPNEVYHSLRFYCWLSLGLGFISGLKNELKKELKKEPNGEGGSTG